MEEQQQRDECLTEHARAEEERNVAKEKRDKMVDDAVSKFAADGGHSLEKEIQKIEREMERIESELKYARDRTGDLGRDLDKRAQELAVQEKEVSRLRLVAAGVVEKSGMADKFAECPANIATLKSSDQIRKKRDNLKAILAKKQVP